MQAEQKLNYESILSKIPEEEEKINAPAAGSLKYFGTNKEGEVVQMVVPKIGKSKPIISTKPKMSFKTRLFGGNK